MQLTTTAIDYLPSSLQVQSLIKGYFSSNTSGTITMAAFKSKFWDAYIRYGRTDIAKLVDPRIEDLKANNIKVSEFSLPTNHETSCRC